MEILHNGNGNWGNTKRIQDIITKIIIDAPCDGGSAFDKFGYCINLHTWSIGCYGKTQLRPLHPLGPSRGGMFILSSHNNPPTDAEKIQFITFLVGFVLPKSTFLAIVFVLSIPERYKTLIHTWIQFMHIGNGKKQSSLGIERQFTTHLCCQWLQSILIDIYDMIPISQHQPAIGWIPHFRSHHLVCYPLVNEQFAMENHHF